MTILQYGNGGGSGGGGGSGDSSWTDADLVNNWSPRGGSWSTPGYRKDRSGIVHLRGAIAGGDGATSTMFILPAGYRPAASALFVCWNATGPVSVIVTADGYVAVEDTLTSPSTAIQLLDGITFWAEG